MKALTVDQIKQFEKEDWMWIVFPSGNSRYSSIVKQCVSGIITREYGGNSLLNYRDYGKTWVAYRNKEEAKCRGTLIESPCEIGTKIYRIQKDCDGWEKAGLCEYYQHDWLEWKCVYKNIAYPEQNCDIYCDRCKERMIICEDEFELELINNIYGTIQYDKSTDLFETYFLTREEAEQRLKELVNEG